MKRIIKIDKEEIEWYQRLLDGDKPIPECGLDDVYETWTANFGKGIEVDIKLVNTSNGPYIDAILFAGGIEMVVLEPQYVLLGEYPFEHNDKNYIVNIKGKQ